MHARRRASRRCCAARCHAHGPGSRACRSAMRRWRSCTSWCGSIRPSQPRLDAARLEREIAAALVSLARSAARGAAARGSAKRSALALDRRYGAGFPGLLSAGRGCAAQAVDDIVDLEGSRHARRSRCSCASTGRPQQPRAARAPAHHPPRRGAVDLRGAADLRALRAARDCRASLSPAPGPMAAQSGSRTSSSSITTCRPIAVPRVAAELIAAFRAVRAGELDDDGFNRLLIAAELRHPPGDGAARLLPLSAADRHPLQPELHGARAGRACATARDLWRCSSSGWRRTPRAARQRAAASSSSACAARSAAVASPDEDRILRAFLAVILATLRTNYFLP